MNIYAQTQQVPTITNEQVRVANLIFIEHKHQKETIKLQDKQIKNLEEQTSILIDKNANSEKKYEIADTLYKSEKKNNKILKVSVVVLTILSIVLGVAK